jgi:hypothetical protein
VGVRLAHETGLSVTCCDRLVKGKAKRPSGETLRLLAGALGVEMKDLLDGAQRELPAARLHPAAAAVIRRFGPALDDAAWQRIAGYIERVAEEQQGSAGAVGYQRVEDPQAQADDGLGKQTA